jgi:hypothetical protein
LQTLRRADASHLSQAVLTQGGIKLQQLNSLRDQLVGGAKDVTALRADIASAVADIRAYTSQIGAATGATQGTSSEKAAQIALREASMASRQTVSDFERDFYQRRIFDPYLRFASASDEETYRQNEAERQREIEKARAEHTPEGDLRANQLALTQLEDAGTHGAKRSPDYAKWHSELQDRGRALASAIDGSHHPAVATARADQRDSVKPDATVSPEVLAALRDAGVTVADQSGSGHGVTSRGKPADRTVQPS